MFGYQLYYSSINPQPKQNRRFYKLYGVMHVGERLRFLHVVKLINQEIQSPSEILDAGAGNGNYAFYLRKIFPKAKITAIDISRKKTANVSNIAHLLNLRDILFAQKTLTNLKEKEKYDLVVCIDVLEHIKNDILAIKNIRDSLKSGGSLILHVPKDRKLVYRHFERFKEFSIEDHAREEYRIEQIADKIKHSGLRIKKFSHTLGWFGSLAWEIDQLLIVHLRKVRYITFPVLYLLILADVYRKNKNGNGFLLHCVKDGN
jgi:2-polyprenyl-3-methyl-5-hydroxy-6-metoxy-1,4-benzoquinol methylase